MMKLKQLPTLCLFLMGTFFTIWDIGSDMLLAREYYQGREMEHEIIVEDTLQRINNTYPHLVDSNGVIVNMRPFSSIECLENKTVSNPVYALYQHQVCKSLSCLSVGRTVRSALLFFRRFT